MFCSESMKRFYSFNQMYLLACLVGLCVCVCSMYIYNSNRIVLLWMICNRVQGIFLLISEEVSSFMKRPLFLQCFKCLWCHKSQRKQWHPLQCPCLENPKDGGAWWAAVYGVAQGRTRLKWLSSSSIVTNPVKIGTGCSRIIMQYRSLKGERISQITLCPVTCCIIS